VKKAQEQDVRQVEGVPQTVLPVEAQARVVSLHDNVEGIVDICSVLTALAAPATGNEGNESQVAQRVIGSVARAPAADADAKKVQSKPPAPPPACTLQNHQSRGNNLQMLRSTCGRAAVVVVGVAAGLGRKPVLWQIFRLDFDENMGETSNTASPIRTPREQFHDYAALGAELHELDDASDSESSPVNPCAKAVGALEQVPDLLPGRAMLNSMRS